METKEISVLHIDTEKTWRGGQQQAVYLHEGLQKKGIRSEFVCQPDSELAKYFCTGKKKFQSIPMKSEIDIFSAVAISNLCRREGFRFLQAHSGHALSIALLTKMMFRNINLVAVRRVDFPIRKNIMSRFKYDSKLIDTHVCISERIKDVLIDSGVSEKRIEVIRSGVDLDKFKNLISGKNIRAELEIGDDKFIVGTVASIVGHKDYPNLIGAAQIVCNENPDVVFVAVGDGELKNKMKKLVTSSGLENRFIFTGHRTDVADFYNMFDLFVLASKKEGLGTSVLDAMAMGLPVVATDAGGIPEMIQNENNGLLVEKQNSQKFAEAILRLTENEKLRTRLSNSAGETVKDFDVSKMINMYIELYHDLLEC